jgi:hypothetical protein
VTVRLIAAIVQGRSSALCPIHVIAGHSPLKTALMPTIHPLGLKAFFSMDARVKFAHDESKTTAHGIIVHDSIVHDSAVELLARTAYSLDVRS